MATKPTDKPTTTAEKKSNTDTNYDKPDLRDKLEEIKAVDKGANPANGAPARLSCWRQRPTVHQYEEAGGGYRHDERTESQQHLQQWTDEQWQTADGKPADRQGGTTRYLPKEAWDELSPAEKKAINAKKQAGSRAGKPVVANTEKAKTARKKVSKEK